MTTSSSPAPSRRERSACPWTLAGRSGRRPTASRGDTPLNETPHTIDSRTSMSHIPLRRALMAVGALGLAAHAATAQSSDQQSAYVALIYTPVAGLPPLPPVTDSLGKSGVSLLGRVGHTSRDGGALTLTSYALGVEIPRGRMRLGATLGYLSASCGFEWQGSNDCAGDIMIGGSARGLITSMPLGQSEAPSKGKKAASSSSNQGKLIVGFDGSVGYSPRQGETAIAAAANLPTGLALQSGS